MIDNYTITVEEIVEQIWNEDNPEETKSIYDIPSFRDAIEKIDEKIEHACPIIFNFNFECWGDENDKLELEKHILSDYYTRNICCDSVAKWILFLRNRLHDIMPKYKALYNAQMMLIAENPLSPYHIEETRRLNENKSMDGINHSINTGNNESSNESNSSNASENSGTDNTTSKDVNKFSNTPQAMAEAIDSGSDIPLNYLSTMQTNEGTNDNNYENITHSSDSSLSKNTSKDNSEYDAQESRNENKVEEYVKEIKGNILKFNNGQLIKDYQNAILNIENMISEELRDLFFQIY